MSWDVGAWVANTLKKLITTKTSELNTTITSGKVPIVRRVQRGTVAFQNDSKGVSVTLSGFSNLSKMIVFIDGAMATDGGDTYLPYVASLSASKLTLETIKSKAWNTGICVSYQVVEVY